MGRAPIGIEDDGLRTVVDQLIAVATVTKTAILCRETIPERCEPLKVLSPVLEAGGIRVLHVLPDGSVRPHEPPLPFDR